MANRRPLVVGPNSRTAELPVNDTLVVENVAAAGNVTVAAGGAAAVVAATDVLIEGETVQVTGGDATSFTYNDWQVWHAGNDGSGSGLDADTLDGAQLSTDDTLAAGSNAKVPSEAAVKGYVYAKAPQRHGANWDNGLDAVVAADAKVVFAECLVAGTIVDIAIMTDNLVDGSCVVDIWKANNAYPTVSDSIVSGTKPAITSAREQTSYSLANLSTTAVAVGDRFGFKLDSAADLSSITVIVTVGPN